MARRRKDPEAPKDWKFKVPEFDENEYIRKETISFRTTVVLFLYSIVTAAISFGLWRLLLPGSGITAAWFGSLLLGLALGYGLRHIYPALKVDISHFGKKEWTGTGFLYFFSWLAFFIFLTNPPIYDGVAPTVEIHATPDVQTTGQPIDITIIAFDNVAVDPDTLSFSITGPGGTVLADATNLETFGDVDAAWQHTINDDAAPGTYTVSATLTDTNGRTTTSTTEVQVSDDALDVSVSGGGVLGTKLDVITVEPPEVLDVWRVWVEPVLPDETEPIRVYLQPADDSGLWTVTPEAKGFRTYFERTGNLSMEFDVMVEEHDTYQLGRLHAIPSPSTLLSSTGHTASFTDEDLLTGEIDTESPKERDLVRRQTPAPGPALVLGAIVIGLLAVARVRRDA